MLAEDEEIQRKRTTPLSNNENIKTRKITFVLQAKKRLHREEVGACFTERCCLIVHVLLTRCNKRMCWVCVANGNPLLLAGN